MDIPIDTVIKRCPVIIEGKVVDVTKAYWNIQTKTSRMHVPFRSYIIQVYKVFKGALHEKYIEVPIEGGEIDGKAVMVSDGVSMPDQGATGIFYLSLPPDSDWSGMFYKSGDTLANHYIMTPYWDPYNYNAMWVNQQFFLENIERNLYRHIEQITGVKRRIISTPKLEDTSVVFWLKRKHEEKQIGKEGLELTFFRLNISNDKKDLTFLLQAKSLASYTDLHSMRIVIHYNNRMFGSYIVKNNVLSWNNHKVPNYMGTTQPPEDLYANGCYEFKIEDEDSTSFAISIISKDTSKGFVQIKNSILTMFHMKVALLHESYTKIGLG